MRSLVTLVFICMLLPKAAVGELMCYTCNPPDCEKFTEVTCPTGADKCLTASATVADKTFTMKACAQKQICDMTQALATGLTLTNVECCQTNLCNGAERFTLSFLFMFVPLLSCILFY